MPALPICSPSSPKWMAKSSPRFWWKRLSRIFHRSGRAQDGHSRIVHLPHHSQRLQSAGGKCAGRNRQGARDRVQHPERRTLQAGRDVRGRSARLSLENAAGYAKQRKAFGKVIADFGLVREKLANMATLIYVGESLVYRTVGMMDVALSEVDKSGADAAKETRKAIEEYAVECSILKVWGSEMMDYVVDETVQIYGGYGFVEEYPAERAYRDARINRIFEGTNEINRLIITGFLLKRAMSGQLPLMPAIKKLMDEVLAGPSPGRGNGRPAGRRAQAGGAGEKAGAVRGRRRHAEIHAGASGPTGNHGRDRRHGD